MERRIGVIDGKNKMCLTESQLRNLNYSYGALGNLSGSFYITMENSMEETMKRIIGSEKVATEMDRRQWEAYNESRQLYGATGLGFKAVNKIPSKDDLELMLERRREYKNRLLLEEVLNDGFKSGVISRFYGSVPPHSTIIPDFLDGLKSKAMDEEKDSIVIGPSEVVNRINFDKSKAIIIDSLGTMEEALGIKPKPESVPFVDKFTTPRNRKERRAAERRANRKGGD